MFKSFFLAIVPRAVNSLRHRDVLNSDDAIHLKMTTLNVEMSQYKP